MSSSFKEYLKECMAGVPAVAWDPNTIYPINSGDLTELNWQLADMTDGEFANPVIAYEQVRQFLIPRGVELPQASFYYRELSDTDGELILPLVGLNNTEMVYLYFAFTEDEDDHDYDILAEIVNTEELEEILDNEDE